MKDPWTDKLSLYLDGDLDDAEEQALASHLRECPDCATAVDELRAVIRRARHLEERPPPGDLWPAVTAAIGIRRRRLAFPFRPAPWLAAAAAAFVALAAVWLWPRQEPSGDRFLLILHEPAGMTVARDPEGRRHIVGQYKAWSRGLAQAGRMVGGEKLEDAGGHVLRRTAGDVTVDDRGGGERIGGYFLIRARDYDEALEIARGCPHLSYGGWIELRRIEDV